MIFQNKFCGIAAVSDFDTVSFDIIHFLGNSSICKKKHKKAQELVFHKDLGFLITAWKQFLY
jgi:hypothetical protein